MLCRPLLACLAAVLLSMPVRAQVSFSEVSVRRGLVLEVEPPAMGSAVGDVDGDGWLDVAFFGAAGDPRPQIFLNRGAAFLAGNDLRWFHNRTSELVSEDAAPASLGLFADMDNDGDQDLVVVRRYYDPLQGEPDPFDTGLEFLRNKNGRFVVDTALPFLGRAQVRHGGISLGDTDVDGDLDVIFAHNGGDGNMIGGPGFYVLSSGWPRFEDFTDFFGAPLGDPNRYFTTVLADYNGDMLPDLHVAVDFFPDFHCRNIGGGVFQDVSTSAGTTNKGADMGCAMGDIENDGDLDLYSTNINVGVLYVNDGTGTFKNEANQRGVGGWGLDLTIGWGTCFADFDLDRDQDLVFVAYGVGKGHCYLNDGLGYFTDVTVGSGLDLRGHGLIPFDYDRDGDEDLLVAKSKGLALFENHATDDPDRHWVVVTLEGTTSNRDGVGSKVVVTTRDGTIQTRFIVAGYSYLNGPPLTAHFGLGDTDQITKLEITWPTGQVQTYGPLKGDQYLHFVE